MDTRGKTRILLVEAYTSVREMLALLLAQESRFAIIGEETSGLAALKLCARARPDVLILDLMLPDLNGVEVLRRVRLGTPAVRTLVYSGTVNESLIIEALQCQPHGFVEKRDSLQTLREAIDAVAAGCTYFSRAASRFLFASLHGRRPTAGDLGRVTNGRCNTHGGANGNGHGSGHAAALSPREREIVQMIAESLCSKQIADRLGVAVKTVENHRTHLMQKLQIHDIAGLTRYAVRHGMVSAD